MPKAVFGKDYRFLPQQDLLSFEEITRIASAFVSMGVNKIRLTGGEPLLRKNLEALVAQLATLHTEEGERLDLTLTTNGSNLAQKARALANAGLRRITVSLDALDDTVFRRMNDVDFSVSRVLTGIDAARAAGLAPLKINMVVQRGVNDHQVVPMAEHFRGNGCVLRFIEYMDVGATNGWVLDQVVPSQHLIDEVHARHPLVALQSPQASDTARRFAYADGAGEIGFISSVSHAFCRDCTRARLSTDGKLYTCLFASNGWDLRSLVRSAKGAEELSDAVHAIWSNREDRYSELRSEASSLEARKRVEMSFIGG